MAHGDAIINANSVKLKRYAARRADSLFYQFPEGLQMDMPWYHVNIRIADGDKGFLEIIFSHNAGCAQQAAMWRSFKAELDLI